MSRQHPQRIPWPVSKLADEKVYLCCIVCYLKARRKHYLCGLNLGVTLSAGCLSCNNAHVGVSKVKRPRELLNFRATRADSYPQPPSAWHRLRLPVSL